MLVLEKSPFYLLHIVPYLQLKNSDYIESDVFKFRNVVDLIPYDWESEKELLQNHFQINVNDSERLHS